MKKFDRMKTGELVLFMLFAGVCFYQIVIASDIYQQITSDSNVMMLCIFLWLSLFLSFACIFVDFSLYSKQNQNLYSLTAAANTDSVANIANRYSIDSIIDEYANKNIPKEMGAAMIELTSLMEVNKVFGRVEGNNLIRSFSLLLSMASLDECIVGRNGGNRFIIIYEKSADLHLDTFLDRLSDKVRDYNADARNHNIKYQYGTAFAEADNIRTITRLIAVSSMRLSEKLTPAADATAKMPNTIISIEETIESMLEHSDRAEAMSAALELEMQEEEEEFFDIDTYVEPLSMSIVPELTEAEKRLIGFRKMQNIDTKRSRIQLRKVLSRI